MVTVQPVYVKLKGVSGVKIKNTWGILSLQQAELWPSRIEQLVWNKG